MRSCTKSSNEIILCTMKGKPLVLPWGRTPRLDSGVRSTPFYRLPLVLRKRPMEAFRPSCCLRTIASWSGLSFGPLCFAIALLGLGPCTTYLVQARRPVIRIARLRFRYLPVLPSSSVVACASATFPCIGRVGERQRAEDEPRLLDTTVGRVVLLLPIAPARAESELDASVDKLFDEGGNDNQAEQGDSASGGHGVGIQLVSEAAKTVVKDATLLQPRRGKSRSAIQWLLAGAVQNAEVRGEPILTLPFVTSSVSATSERKDESHTVFATRLNLRTIGAPPKFVISLDSSHHSGVNIAEAEVDYFATPSVLLMTVATTVTSKVDHATTVKENFVVSSVFGGDSSGRRADHTVGGFSDLTGSDFIVGCIRIVISPDTDLQKVYVPQWSVTNGSRLDDGRTCHEMVDEFAPPKFFASVEEWSMISYSLNSMLELLARCR
ncbi:hypothetical protein Tco_0277557 [Tanacetum coccineum]